eukprot:11979324-Alexandrium_andersonii.AAC.1
MSGANGLAEVTYGTLPGLPQTVPRAELFAVRRAVEMFGSRCPACMCTPIARWCVMATMLAR